MKAKELKKVITALEAVNTLEDLTKVVGVEPKYDIGHRGGNLGFQSSFICKTFGIPDNLPNMTGCFVNYLGGGIRGSICGSELRPEYLNKTQCIFMEELISACKRVYENIENGSGLNSDYEDGDTNWDAEATKAARRAGTVSAY